MRSNFNVQVIARPGKVGRVASWSVRIALALIFVATGATKILSVQQLVDGFALIGIGQWFRYFTGAIEISGALLLLRPLTSAFGALIILAVSVGAFFVQRFIMHGDVVHTLVLVAVSGWLVWTGRDTLLAVIHAMSRTRTHAARQVE